MKLISHPNISVITPSYNQGQFIERTIKSVLDQNYPNLEYIVMDGGSTDNTLKILKKYDGRIKWFSENDRGQTHAINKGMKMAYGDILAYLNSDDTYEPNTLETVAEYFMQNPKSVLVYGNADYINENDKLIKPYPVKQMDFEKLKAECGICQPAAFWKKELLETIGYFDEKYNYCMDYDYWIRTSKKYPLNYIQKKLASSRLHNDAKSVGQNRSLCLEIMKLEKNHFKIVHINWIMALANSTHLSEPRNTFGKRFTYYADMLNKTIVYQWIYNKRLPSFLFLRTYAAWIKELILTY